MRVVECAWPESYLSESYTRIPRRRQLSLTIGRIQTVLLCKVCGVSLLVAMAFLTSPQLVLPMYLLRTWLMNSPQGLTKSVLNDYVPKKHREYFGTRSHACKPEAAPALLCHSGP